MKYNQVLLVILIAFGYFKGDFGISNSIYFVIFTLHTHELYSFWHLNHLSLIAIVFRDFRLYLNLVIFQMLLIILHAPTPSLEEKTPQYRMIQSNYLTPRQHSHLPDFH